MYIKKADLQFIRQHFPQLLLSEHTEALLQHLLLVADIGHDWLKRQTEVKTPILYVTADPVQFWVSEVILAILPSRDKMLQLQCL